MVAASHGYGQVYNYVLDSYVMQWSMLEYGMVFRHRTL